MKNTSFLKKRWLWVPLYLFIAIIGACGLYAADYYRADEAAVQAFSMETTVQQTCLGRRICVYAAEETDRGFIFYPGGKVAAEAYEPLMRACAERGFTCVLLEMPLNLAVLDINAAAGIPEQFPHIRSWYIGGHSLGGSMAASHAAKNPETYKGIVLLASYSTADLSRSGMKVLSVYGSEDGVLNMEKYASNRANLPDDFHEIVIDGGCHAGFGMYGSQNGDGHPSISAGEQIRHTADAIQAFAAD